MKLNECLERLRKAEILGTSLRSEELKVDSPNVFNGREVFSKIVDLGLSLSVLCEEDNQVDSLSLYLMRVSNEVVDEVEFERALKAVQKIEKRVINSLSAELAYQSLKKSIKKKIDGYDEELEELRVA